MIIIEGTFWPVIFLGAVDETTSARSNAVVLTDELLELSERLAIGVVVAGTGDQGVRSQQEALDWLESHEHLLRSRTLRLAWVIEDERIRACTDTWLRCMRQTLLTVRSVTFRTVRPALSWLLEAPWVLGATLDGHQQRHTKARAPGTSELRAARLASQSR